MGPVAPPVTSPAIWTRQWGEGRIFVCHPRPPRRDPARTPTSAPSSSGACCGPAAERRHRSAAARSPRSTSTTLRPAASRVDAWSPSPTSIPPRPQAVADDARGVRALQRATSCWPTRRVDLVLNLTIPAAHAEIALRAIAAGKDVYGEKPLAATTAEAGAVLEPRPTRRVSASAARRTPCWAPASRPRGKAIDDGLIGGPISATATMVTPGPRALAPQPRLLLPARRRARCWTWARTTSPPWSRCWARWSRVIGAASRTRARADDRLRAARRARSIPVDDRHARHRRAGPRVRRAVHAGDELRRGRHRVGQHRGPRRAGLAGRPGPEPFRRRRAAVPAGRRRLGDAARVRRLPGCGPRLRHRRPGRARLRDASRAPAGSWPSTSWRSWKPCSYQRTAEPPSPFRARR